MGQSWGFWGQGSYGGAGAHSIRGWGRCAHVGRAACDGEPHLCCVSLLAVRWLLLTPAAPTAQEHPRLLSWHLLMLLCLLGLPLGLLPHPLTGKAACKQGDYKPSSRWHSPHNGQRLHSHHLLLRLLKERRAAVPPALHPQTGKIAQKHF